MEATQINSTNTIALTHQEIKREMKRRRGFGPKAYSRMIKRTAGAVTRLIDGEIGGELRERFLKFFNFTEEEVPYRGWRKD